MALMAIAIPILPGKTEQWKQLAAAVMHGPRSAEHRAKGKALGIHERVFLQQTPHGDLAIVTMEGENPEQSFAQYGQGSDPFTEWFVTQVNEIHGINLRNPPPGGFPELMIDSHA